ncbi:MAG: FAD-dependent oxidoreductase [Candidatus Omnitrophica bacterium]|jgi:alkyl hydroperoxide reductase subunit F|nr:FAD-dependent oxidoreductase [Candidatus Omnitrophota bacterium]
MYDLIIIGAGPAGITAAVYAARKRMKTLVLTGDIGGQAAWSGDIENYTGYQFISGPELAAKFEEHLRKYDLELKENEQVVGVKKSGDIILVQSAKSSYEARTIIIASGKRTKELNVPGEKEFKNKGVTYCATCDGPLFSGKDVVVVGGGNSALDAALQLINIVKHVYIVNVTANLGGDAVMREKVEANKIVTILNKARVSAILGEKMVNAIKVIKEGKEETLAVQGVFVEIGLIPNSEFAPSIERNQLGEIKINCHNETSIPGIFAAGDVTDVPEKQIIIAAGEGSKAALSVFSYLARHKF